MKTLKIWSAIIVIASLASCNHENEIENLAALPTELKSSFQDQFPNAKEIEWSQSENLYEAEFIDNGIETEVIYNNQGEIQQVITEKEISYADLPPSSRAYISEKFNDYTTIEVKEIKSSDNAIFYEIELQKLDEIVELIFDSEGDFVSEEIEEDSDDDSDDD